jgi:hypothetical protein
MSDLVYEQRRKIAAAVNDAHNLDSGFVKTVKDNVGLCQYLAQPAAEIVSGTAKTRIFYQCERPRSDLLDLRIGNFLGSMEGELGPDAGHLAPRGRRPDKMVARPCRAAGASP